MVCSSCALIRINSNPAGFLEQAPVNESKGLAVISESLLSWGLPLLEPSSHPLYGFQCYELNAEQEQQIIHQPEPLILFYSFWNLFFRQISYRESQTSYWNKKRKMLAHPHFGNATTPIEAVNHFYKFWLSFEGHWQREEVGGTYHSDPLPNILNRLKRFDPRIKADIVRERLQKRADVHSKMRAIGRVYITYLTHTPSGISARLDLLDEMLLYVFSLK